MRTQAHTPIGMATEPPQPPRARARRFAPVLVVATTLWISLACAAAAPVMQQFVSETSNPQSQPPWAVAQIAKPSQTAVATSLPPAATPQTTDPEINPTVAPETAVPEIQLPATPVPASSEPEESNQITMVIVDDPPQPESTAETSPQAAPGGKYVLVSISEQHLYAYENGQLVYSFVASTGMGNSTRVGMFQILDKIPNAYGANWDIWMPNWLGIYWSGTLENGIHALPILPGGGRLWAGFLGTPISYGCVVLGVDESMQLYEWADVGTPVEIRW